MSQKSTPQTKYKYLSPPEKSLLFNSVLSMAQASSPTNPYKFLTKYEKLIFFNGFLTMTDKNTKMTNYIFLTRNEKQIVFSGFIEMCQICSYNYKILNMSDPKMSFSVNFHREKGQKIGIDTQALIVANFEVVCRGFLQESIYLGIREKELLLENYCEMARACANHWKFLSGIEKSGLARVFLANCQKCFLAYRAFNRKQRGLLLCGFMSMMQEFLWGNRLEFVIGKKMLSTLEKRTVDSGVRSILRERKNSDYFLTARQKRQVFSAFMQMVRNLSDYKGVYLTERYRKIAYGG
jgi:hypothetical protein